MDEVQLNAEYVRDWTPTALDYICAIGTIRDQYPADIFPADSDSSDAKAGTWARHVCDLILAEAHRRVAVRLNETGGSVEA